MEDSLKCQISPLVNYRLKRTILVYICFNNNAVGTSYFTKVYIIEHVEPYHTCILIKGRRGAVGSACDS